MKSSAYKECVRKDIHQELFRAYRPRWGFVVCRTVTFKTGNFNLKGLQMKTFPTIPERQSRRERFSDFLFLLVFQWANHHNLQPLRADSTAAHPGQLLRLFWSSTCHSCSKNMGRWREICLVKQITKKIILQTFAPILIRFFALAEWFSKGRVLVGLCLEWSFGFQELYPPKNNSQKVHAGDGNPASTAPLPEHSSSPQPHQGPVRELIHTSFVIVPQFTLIC